MCLKPVSTAEPVSKTATLAFPAKPRGFGLPVAIFIITVMAFIAVAINELGEDNAQVIGANALSLRAFYAAESGANIALHRRFPPSDAALACTANFISNLTFDAGLSQCQADVSCSSFVSGGKTIYRFTSTGVCGSGADQATRVVRVVAE